MSKREACCFKNYLKNNIILLFLYCKFKNILNPNYKNYKVSLNRIRKIDSIKNYKQFKEEIKCFLNKNYIQSDGSYGEETLYYGYYNQILQYANVSKQCIPWITSLEHGVRFGKDKWLYSTQSIAYGCQGENRTDEIRDCNPWKPVVTFGPYIHYASNYYDEQEFLNYKEQLGKVLLVFPCHTCEVDSRKNEYNDLYNIVYEKYATYYDSIMVCVYWNDVNNHVLEQYEKSGAILVSAGFRGDQEFVKRLKTIISFADAVVTDDLGTNIGFAYYMGKKVFLENDSSVLSKNDDYYADNFLKFKQAFYSPDMQFTKEQLLQQKLLYNGFWGGSNNIKTSEEIRLCFQILKRLCKYAKYNTENTRNAIQILLKKCKNDDERKELLRLLGIKV